MIIERLTGPSAYAEKNDYATEIQIPTHFSGSDPRGRRRTTHVGPESDYSTTATSANAECSSGCAKRYAAFGYRH
jgi:hypothetical protein